ncbi:MAG: DNA internalization-related competence protein ComEC/Rec2 [Acidobacteriota bacterium]
MQGRDGGRGFLWLAFAAGAALSTSVEASPLWGVPVLALWPLARRVRELPLLPVLAALLGVSLGTLRAPPPPPPLAAWVQEAGGTAFLWARGRVLRAEPWTGGCRALLEIQRVDWNGEEREAAARAEAFLPLPPPVEGSPFEGSLLLRPPRRATNPGQGDREERLLRQRVALTATARSEALFQTFAPPPLSLIARYRRALEKKLLEARPEEAGVLLAVLLGERGLLPDDQQESLGRSGLYHLVALSGQHVGLLLLLFAAAAHATGLPPRRRDLGGLLLLLLFGLLALSSPSLLRALFMAGLFLLSRLLARPQGALGAWCFAAAALLGWNPAWVFDAGFLLTFAATFGIVALWEALPDRWIPRGAGQGLVRLLWAGFCAQIATFPLVVSLFHRVSPLAWLATPLASLPLLGILALGLPYLAGLAFVPLLGPLLRGGLALLARAFLWLPENLGSLPSATLFVPKVSPFWTGLHLLALLLLARRGKSRRAGWILLGFAVTGALAAPHPFRKPPVPSLVVLDVGQASCQVLLGGEEALLVDAGSPSPSGALTARTVVEPFLAEAGVKRLRGVVLTHWDADHAGALPELLLDLPVGFIAYPAADPPGEGLPARIAARCRLTGAALVPLAAGERARSGPWRLEVLHPPARWDSRDENDRSLVLRAVGTGPRVLFTGDISSRAEEELLRRGPPGPVDVLLAPHHGSRTSSSEAFVAAVSPRRVVFSAGPRERFGHPAPAVEARYRRGGAALFTTRETGALLFRREGRGTLAFRFRDGDWAGELLRGEGAQDLGR